MQENEINEPIVVQSKKSKMKTFCINAFAFLKKMGASLWKIVRHNIGIKLLCLLSAICIWGMLISQDDSLLREKTIDNVQIDVVNEEYLLRNGLVVVSGLEKELLSGVQIKVDVPQKYYPTVTKNNYNIRVDLSGIKEAGEHVLPVVSTKTASFGNVTETSVKELPVVVEEYVSRSRIPVRIETTGKLQDGMYGEVPSADPRYVEIVGAKSLVDSIVRCVAYYDMDAISSTTQGLQRTAVSFVLQDAHDASIPVEDVDVLAGGIKIDSIIVEQAIHEVITVPISNKGLVKGKVKEGYTITDIQIEPSHTQVVLSAEGLLQPPKALYVDGTIDVQDATDSFETVHPLLSMEEALTQSINEVTVKVFIEPINNN